MNSCCYCGTVYITLTKYEMSFYMNTGPSSLINLSHDELKELLQDDFKLDERVQETVRGITQ